jgi:hypothetical protein
MPAINQQVAGMARSYNYYSPKVIPDRYFPVLSLRDFAFESLACCLAL